MAFIPEPDEIAGICITNGGRKTNYYQFQTTYIIVKSREIQERADIVTMQSDALIVEMKERLVEHTGLLFEASEATALLDMLTSFAQLSSTQNYVRPGLTDNLAYQGLRHPVLELRKPNFVPNDVYSGATGMKFMVITGSNMSGKSTVIRSIALAQIMAQMGCFVPARFASISICDRIFTRLSTEDKPELNLGTFAVEMREMSVCLQ